MNLAKNFKTISAYKLEKHTDDWDKTYCCHTSVHIIDISHPICLYVGRQTTVKRLE